MLYFLGIGLPGSILDSIPSYWQESHEWTNIDVDPAIHLGCQFSDKFNRYIPKRRLSVCILWDHLQPVQQLDRILPN